MQVTPQRPDLRSGKSAGSQCGNHRRVSADGHRVVRLKNAPFASKEDGRPARSRSSIGGQSDIAGRFEVPEEVVVQPSRSNRDHWAEGRWVSVEPTPASSDRSLSSVSGPRSSSSETGDAAKVNRPKGPPPWDASMASGRSRGQAASRHRGSASLERVGEDDLIGGLVMLMVVCSGYPLRAAALRPCPVWVQFSPLQTL